MKYTGFQKKVGVVAYCAAFNVAGNQQVALTIGAEAMRLVLKKDVPIKELRTEVIRNLIVGGLFRPGFEEKDDEAK
jgi:hypothetical protein